MKSDRKLKGERNGVGLCLDHRLDSNSGPGGLVEQN